MKSHYETAIQEAEAEVSALRGREGGAKEALDTAKNNLSEIRKQIKKLERQVALLKSWGADKYLGS